MPEQPPAPPSPPSGDSLRGQRVLVTRAGHQAADLCRLLAAEGADPRVLPVIRISDPPDWTPVDAALARLDRYDWVVFSSGNGVRAVLERLARAHGGAEPLARVRLAAVGPGTAAVLQEHGLAAEVPPEQRFHAEGLAAVLAPRAAGARFLLARANRGRDVLAAELRASGGEVDEVVVYSSEDVSPDDPEVGAAAAGLAQGEIDWVTLTSSAIARSTVRLLGPSLGGVKLASLSPITSATLRELGFKPTVEADSPTLGGLVAAMGRHPAALADEQPVAPG